MRIIIESENKQEPLVSVIVDLLRFKGMKHRLSFSKGRSKGEYVTIISKVKASRI